MSQAEHILEHLRSRGSITPREAYELYGCLALHSRIAELRDLGHDIPCSIRSSGSKRWGEYRLRVESGVFAAA